MGSCLHLVLASACPWLLKTFQITFNWPFRYTVVQKTYSYSPHAAKRSLWSCLGVLTSFMPVCEVHCTGRPRLVLVRWKTFCEVLVLMELHLSSGLRYPFRPYPYLCHIILMGLSLPGYFQPTRHFPDLIYVFPRLLLASLCLLSYLAPYSFACAIVPSKYLWQNT